MHKFLGNVIAGIIGAALFAGLAGPLVRPVEGSYIPVPSGAIFYFDRTTATGCPVGYTEYTGARGAYIVGLTNGGTKATLVGSALTNQENRTHTHSVPGLTVPALTISASGVLDIVSGATASSKIGTNAVGDAFTWTRPDLALRAVASNAGAAMDAPYGGATHSHGGATGTGTTGTGTSGTNSVTPAPYIQLLTCQKT